MNSLQTIAVKNKIVYLKEARDQQQQLADKYERMGNEIAKDCRVVAIQWIQQEISFLEQLLNL